MLTVYRVCIDRDYYSLEPVDQQAYLAARRKNWKFDGLAIDGSWEPLEVYVRRPTLLKPDIYGIANTLVFEPRAAALLQPCLDYAGELLKLPFEDRNLLVLNVTYVINCLDKKRSVYEPDLPHIIDKYVFHGDRLDYSLFKIPETRVGGEILTVEGIASPNDEFKPLVEKHGLKGLRFEPLWSSSD